LAAPKARSDNPWEKEPDPITGSLWFSKVADPVFIIPFISFSFYFFVYCYYQAFFERLSLPFKGLDFPITFYLSIGHLLTVLFITIISFIIFTYIIWAHSVISVDLSIFYKTIVKMVIESLAILIFLFLAKFILAIIPIPREGLWTFNGIFDALIFLIFWFLLIDTVILIVSYIKIKNRTKYTESENKYYLYFDFIFVLPIFILSILILPYICGYFSAGSLIEGSPGNLNISFELIDSDIDIINNPLILVIYHNDIYYVVEKRAPAPERATLHIIPGKMVKKATISPIYELRARQMPHNFTDILNLFNSNFF